MEVSTSLVFREIQIKITMRYHYALGRWLNLEGQDDIKCGQGGGDIRTLLHWSIHWHNHFGKLAVSANPSGLPWWLKGKESACHAGASGDANSILGLGRSPGGGHGNPLQYSCPENPVDRGGMGYRLLG